MKKKGNKRKKFKKKIKIPIILFFIIIALLIAVFLIRNFSSKDLDDVNLFSYCPKELIDKSDVLFVTPILNNVSIATNESWCQHVLNLNKTIGMHGVYHEPNIPGEFAISRDREYILSGMEEFKKCFGFYPYLFKAPQIKLSYENRELLKEMNFTIFSEFHSITHKNYHCIDKEQKSYLVKINDFMDFF